jgi:two-component system chemotaxis response regulator CheB
LAEGAIDSLKHVKLVAIGTSTGGPMALHDVLSKLPAEFPVPIMLIQHMPGSFTSAFAERLNTMCKIEVREAQDGDLLRPGLALLAPGGKQMVLEKKNNMHAIRIIDSDIKINYKPCIDVTFHSIAAEVDNSDKVLTIIMTGMGSDGREGIRKMRKMGQTMEVWVQDEASSVVYGMPSSVVEAGLSDHVVSLSELGISLAQGIR